MKSCYLCFEKKEGIYLRFISTENLKINAEICNECADKYKEQKEINTVDRIIKYLHENIEGLKKLKIPHDEFDIYLHGRLMEAQTILEFIEKLKIEEAREMNYSPLEIGNKKAWGDYWDRGFSACLEMVLKIIDKSDMHTLPIMLRDEILEEAEIYNRKGKKDDKG